jgi:pimeloyl-ACP methyl ester carboxylesterase
VAELEVEGVRLVYDVHGDGPPVLLVAGTGMPAAVWGMTAVPPLLAAGYQVITYDNRGIAPSDIPPPPYTVEEMAGDAIALLEHLDVGPAAAMGASLGGTIVQVAALARPDLIGAAAFLVGIGRLSAFALVTVEAMLEVMEGEADPSPALTAALMAPTLLAPPKWGDDDAVAGAVAMASMFLPPDRTGLIGQYQANIAWAGQGDHLDELAGLTVPVLAFAAEFDAIFPPSAVRAAVDRIPGARYVELAAAPHIALDPASNEAIARELVAFLAEHHPARR